MFVFNQVSGRRFLSIDRIGADQGPAQIELVQKIFERGDLVGFGRDSNLAADDFGLDIQSAEKLDRLSLDFGGGAEGFSIDGQGGNAQILEVRTQPACDRAVQLARIQTLQDAPDGALARSQPFACLAAASCSQTAELVLIEGLGKLTDIQQAVVACDHGGGSNGDN